MDTSLDWIKQQLLQMLGEQLLHFHAIMHGYSAAADKYGL